MALVNGGFLHYMDMNKFLKNLLLRNCWSDFEIIHRNVTWVTLFKNCLQNCDLSINMALLNGGFLHYTDMQNSCLYTAKKSCSQKPLVRF